MANDNNFVMLILIAIIVFLLFMMNRTSSAEGFDSTTTDTSLTTDSNITTKILNTSATNASIANLVPPSNPVSVSIPTSVPSVPATIPDIFMNSTANNQSIVPTGLQSNTYSAAFNNDLGDNTNPSSDLVNLINNNTNTLKSGDLLPNEAPNDFNTFKINATYLDSNLAADAVHLVGVDTIGSTKRNASTDLRGNVPCPKFAVSPWNNSTIDPDTNNKGFC